MYLLTANYTAYEYDGYDPKTSATPVKRQMFHLFLKETDLKEYILGTRDRLIPPFQKFEDLSDVKIYPVTYDLTYKKDVTITLTREA